MTFTRFITNEHPNGTYALVDDHGSLEILRGGLFDPVEKTGEVVHEDQIVRYLPPLNPVNLLAIGKNYKDHAAELKGEVPKSPLLFMKANTAVIAHGDNILLPKVAPDNVDYEAELAVIIGRKARHVPVEEALNYVFGYTCANDVSARDCQMGDGQWVRGKSFDTFAPLGPYVVTEFDHSDRRIQMRLNGQVMQDQQMSDIVFDPAKLISYFSACMTLLPGTVILTGTPGGVGFARTPPVFLRPGDVCEIDIEGIGVLTNTVAAE